MRVRRPPLPACLLLLQASASPSALSTSMWPSTTTPSLLGPSSTSAPPSPAPCPGPAAATPGTPPAASATLRLATSPGLTSPSPPPKSSTCKGRRSPDRGQLSSGAEPGLVYEMALLARHEPRQRACGLGVSGIWMELSTGANSAGILPGNLGWHGASFPL